MEYIIYIVLIILIIVIFSLVNTIKHINRDNAFLIGENERFKDDNAFLEASNLKFQLQPHTLNNILSNLKVISNDLNRGLDSLSYTLEYILYKGHENYVSVEDEIDFIKRYLELNEVFISQIDAITVNDIGVNKNLKTYKSQCIPHLCSAYFLENAFKHGDKMAENFLKVNIFLTEEEFQLQVINKLRHNVSSTNGGLGLQNMRKRFDILIPEKYTISNSCNEYEYHSIIKISFV